MSGKGERAPRPPPPRPNPPAKAAPAAIVAPCRAKDCTQLAILDPLGPAVEWPLCSACRAKKRAVEARWGVRR